MEIEVHLVEKGYQTYHFDSTEVRVEEGCFLWISPKVAHVAAAEVSHTIKYAVCLRIEEGSALEGALGRMEPFVMGRVPEFLWEHIRTIREEKRKRAPYYRAVVENRSFECVVSLFRTVGLTMDTVEPFDSEDHRLTIAKQYIEDNIERSISLSELAAYCYLSEKQLTRIFRQREGVSAAEYVRQRRCRKIEELLAGSDLTLCAISEQMGFSSEYYFNAFYKKYAGMTPGAYRRSVSEQ